MATKSNKSNNSVSNAVSSILGAIPCHKSMVFVAINLDMIPVARGGDKNADLLTLKGQGKMMSTSSKNGEVSGLPFLKASHFGLWDAVEGKELSTKVDIDGETMPLNLHVKSVSGNLALEMLVAAGVEKTNASKYCINANTLWTGLCCELPAKGLQLQMVCIFDADQGCPEQYEGRKWYSIPLTDNIVGFRVVAGDQSFWWSSVSHAWKPNSKSEEITVTIGEPPLTKKSGEAAFKGWVNNLFKKGMTKETILSKKEELFASLTGRLATWVTENKQGAEDILSNWKVKSSMVVPTVSAAEIDFAETEPTTNEAPAAKPVVSLKVKPVAEVEPEKEPEVVVPSSVDDGVDLSDFGL